MLASKLISINDQIDIQDWLYSGTSLKRPTAWMKKLALVLQWHCLSPRFPWQPGWRNGIYGNGVCYESEYINNISQSHLAAATTSGVCRAPCCSSGLPTTDWEPVHSSLAQLGCYTPAAWRETSWQRSSSELKYLLTLLMEVENRNTESPHETWPGANRTEPRHVPEVDPGPEDRHGSSVLPVCGRCPHVYSCVDVFSLQWQHDWQGQATLPHLKPKSALAPQARRRRVLSQPPPQRPRPSSGVHIHASSPPTYSRNTHAYIQTHTLPDATTFVLSVEFFFSRFSSVSRTCDQFFKRLLSVPLPVLAVLLLFKFCQALMRPWLPL